MTYPSFLDKYAGQFAWIFDYRRGSTRELVSGTAATVVGTPQFRRGEVNSQVYTSYIHYGDNFDITDWTQPCVYVLDCTWDALATTDFWMPISKYAAVPGWFVQVYGGGVNGFNLSLQKHVSGGQYVISAIANQVVSSKWRKRTRSVSVFQDRGLWSAANVVSSIHNGEWLTTPGTVSGVGGAAPAVNAFQNAANFAMLPTLAGWTHGGAVSFAAKIMGTLTNDEIFAIYREVAADKPVIARARKHFSIPYASQTAAEYAADSCVFDLQPAVRDNIMLDLAGGYDLDLSGGQKDVVQGGPFDESVMNMANAGGVTPAIAYGGTTQLTVSGWICKFGAGAGTGVICESSTDFSAGNGRFIVLVDGGTTNCLQAGIQAGGATSANNTAAGSLPSGVWQHFAVTYDSTDAMRLYLGGTFLQLVALLGVGPLTDQVLYVFARNLATAYLSKLQLGMLKIRTRTMTPDEIRAEYLEGARKCLLDARLHRDGSCPVNLAAVTTAQQAIVPGLWTVTSQAGLAGSWRVTEDAPTDARPGKRWLSGSALGYAYIRHPEAPYGSWLLEGKQAGGQSVYFVIANTTSTWISDAASQGYVVLFNNTQVQLYRFTGGASTLLATGTPVGMAAATAYKFWVTRSTWGLFEIWIKGGVFADWTFVVSVTDSTYTSSQYMGALVNAAGDIGDVVHYLG